VIGVRVLPLDLSCSRPRPPGHAAYAKISILSPELAAGGLFVKLLPHKDLWLIFMPFVPDTVSFLVILRANSIRLDGGMESVYAGTVETLPRKRGAKNCGV